MISVFSSTVHFCFQLRRKNTTSNSPLLRFASLCFASLRFASLCFALLRFASLCFALLCFALLCFALLCLNPRKTQGGRGVAFEGNKVAVYSIPWKTIRTLTVTYFQPYEPKCISAQGENAKFFDVQSRFTLIRILLLERNIITSTSTSTLSLSLSLSPRARAHARVREN